MIKTMLTSSGAHIVLCELTIIPGILNYLYTASKSYTFVTLHSNVLLRTTFFENVQAQRLLKIYS